jgi:hypothetical protein
VTSYRIRRSARGVCSLLLAALAAAHVDAQIAPDPGGESIYRQGILPSGRPLTAKREPNLQISGADAACSNCHQRSGLGEIEGHISIPPISGPYLFRPRAAAGDNSHLPLIDSMRPDRDPYTDDSLARAIREGVGVDGRPLNYLMPHYSLSDADMAALTGYLKGMMPSKVPGVTGSELSFATIIAPDADPIQRKGLQDVLEHFFADKNASALAGSARVSAAHRMEFKPNRRWLLHVWELSGPPATWDQQLRKHLSREPVLAVISGLGGKTWAPVHRFCEQAALPCLFPNVDLPVVAENDFYPLYFSRGVLLEADLIARRLTGTYSPPSRIVQVFRAGDIGEQAAGAMRASASGMRIVDRTLGGGSAKPQLAAVLRDVDAHDVLVLWLRPADLASLPESAAKPKVFMSGLMGGLDQSPLPAAWRSVTQMAYPFDLADKRRIRMDYPLGWFRLRHIPVVDERLQADTYIACEMLDETLNHMADAIYRDYLVEHMEHMLEHQLVTGYYPRLTMAPNQRFASKGGYIVRFAGPAGTRVIADGDWTVP